MSNNNALSNGCGCLILLFFGPATLFLIGLTVAYIFSSGSIGVVENLTVAEVSKSGLNVRPFLLPDTNQNDSLYALLERNPKVTDMTVRRVPYSEKMIGDTKLPAILNLSSEYRRDMAELGEMDSLFEVVDISFVYDGKADVTLSFTMLKAHVWRIFTNMFRGRDEVSLRPWAQYFGLVEARAVPR